MQSVEAEICGAVHGTPEHQDHGTGHEPAVLESTGNVDGDEQHGVEQGFNGHVAQIVAHLGAHGFQTLDGRGIVGNAGLERGRDLFAQILIFPGGHGEAQQIVAVFGVHLLHGETGQVHVLQRGLHLLVGNGLGELDLHHDAAGEVHAVAQAAVHDDGDQAEDDEESGDAVGNAAEADKVDVDAVAHLGGTVGDLLLGGVKVE